MKKKYILIFIIIFITLIGFIIFLSFYDKYNMEVLCNNSNQTEALKYIYEDFLNVFNMNNKNLYLDDSCLKNFITGEEFEEENKIILKSIEIKNEEYEFSYKIFSKYDDRNSTLNLSLERQDGNQISEQKYRIYVKNNAIKYERDGMLTTKYTTINK